MNCLKSVSKLSPCRIVAAALQFHAVLELVPLCGSGGLVIGQMDDASFAVIISTMPLATNWTQVEPDLDE
eukprot:scaffold64632_cov25-Prasinocladus_malaysianus.AAC.4